MKLKEIRESKGITQKALAEMSGVNQRTVQNFEQGKNDIRQAAVIKVYALAKALGCTVEDLIKVDNDRTITATKAAPNIPVTPTVYAVSANDVIENMEAELELCNKVLDDVNIVGTTHMIYSRVAEMLREQIDFVKGLPPVEPEPRKGKWIGKYPVTSVCSECNYLIHDSKVKVFAYCPNCGAKMGGEANEWDTKEVKR